MEARCSPQEGRETGDSEAQGSEVRSGGGRSVHTSVLGGCPILPIGWRLQGDPVAWHTSPPRLQTLPSRSSSQTSEPGFCFAICCRFFSPFPFFQKPVWDSAPRGGWKEQHSCLWKSCFPCHMTSVGYIATFHMAAQTPTVVFMKTLLIPTWSLPGTQGSFSGCVGCVLLRGAADKGWLGKSASPAGALCGETAPLHPDQDISVATLLSSRRLRWHRRAW